MLAMGGGLIGNNMADRIVDAFLNTPFEAAATSGGWTKSKAERRTAPRTQMVPGGRFGFGSERLEHGLRRGQGGVQLRLGMGLGNEHGLELGGGQGHAPLQHPLEVAGVLGHVAALGVGAGGHRPWG